MDILSKAAPEEEFMIPIVPRQTLDELTATAGGKAAGLARLLNAGLEVPEAHAVPSSVFDQFVADSKIDLNAEPSSIRDAILIASLTNELTSALSHLGCGPWAVRSSALAEDGRDHSYAGLFESCLNVEGKTALTDAVRKCWASGFSDRIQAYESANLSPTELRTPQKMAIVIQKMVPAKFAGVAFSIDVVTGDDRWIIIEAVSGLGDTLVDGKVNPERYHVDRFTLAISKTEHPTNTGIPSHPSPPEELILSIARATIQAQAEVGYPVDLEWAAEESCPAFLQLRPVTSMGSTFIEGQWTTADFKDGGVSADVCTPMMWSLYGDVLQRSMQSYLENAGMLARQDKRQWGMMAYGRPYWNVEALKGCLLRLPGFKEHELDTDLGIGFSYEGVGRSSRMTTSTIFRGLNVFLKLKHRFKRALRHQENCFQSVCRHIEEAGSLNYQSLPLPELRSAFRRLITEHHQAVESAYFTALYDASNFNTLFKETLGRHFGSSEYLDLIGGLSNVSHTRLVSDIESLASEIREDPEQWQHWLETEHSDLLRELQTKQDESTSTLFRDLIANHGHRARRELDLTIPRYREEPEELLRLLQGALRIDERAEPTTTASPPRHQQVLAKICQPLSPRKARTFKKRLDELRRFLWWREELRDQSTRLYEIIRCAALALGKKLVTANHLEHHEDVLFAKPYELFEAPTGKATSDSLRQKLSSRRSYYLGYRNFKNPDDLIANESAKGLSKPPTPGSKELIGVASSVGIVEGRARVLSNPGQASLLEPGDILVARYTDPSWTPLFRHAGGIVTETGGVLSHAAVIAREYAIPAVLAVESATTRIKNGAWIEVDGAKGQVVLLEGDSQSQI